MCTLPMFKVSVRVCVFVFVCIGTRMYEIKEKKGSGMDGYMRFEGTMLYCIFIKDPNNVLIINQDMHSMFWPLKWFIVDMLFCESLQYKSKTYQTDILNIYYYNIYIIYKKLTFILFNIENPFKFI